MLQQRLWLSNFDNAIDILHNSVNLLLGQACDQLIIIKLKVVRNLSPITSFSYLQDLARLWLLHARKRSLGWHHRLLCSHSWSLHLSSKVRRLLWLLLHRRICLEETLTFEAIVPGLLSLETATSKTSTLNEQAAQPVALLRTGEIIHKELLDPLILHRESELLFLQLLALGLPESSCLMDRTVHDVWPQGVQHFVEEISVGKPLRLLSDRVRQVLNQFG